ETLQAIWDDQETIVTPSWLGRAPKYAGSAATGTLKADEWRNFCSVFLVFSLIKRWAGSTPRHKELLENFMHLVSLTELASLRSTTPEIIDAYEVHILAYLKGHKKLFLHKHFVPNQHTALHLGHFLKRFGPVHSWRAFPFERYNGMMQSINTNSKLG
ncbi:hypothetical protein SISNIDRAFT_394410, partial [Sistotremastrum niveocremeum HHB9708]